MAVGSDCPSAKLQFATKEAAGEARDSLRALHARQGVRSSVNAYRCMHCGCWHVGNRQSRAARRERSGSRR